METNTVLIILFLHYRSFEFELWADRTKLISGLNLISAFASYYELCFVFQLKYPSQCQTVSLLMQLHVLKYGDQDSGTLAVMRKNAAHTKINTYLMVLGQILVKV